MAKLTSQQMVRLNDHLIRTGVSDELMGELLDHLACEVENYLWKGLSFELAVAKAVSDVNVSAVITLHKDYQRELTLSGPQLETASKDDIVFQFRNKAYGAYALRREYAKTLRNAIVMALGLVMILIVLIQMISKGSFSYWSIWGALWLIGMGAVTFAGLSWYVEREQQRLSSTP